MSIFIFHFYNCFFNISFHRFRFPEPISNYYWYMALAIRKDRIVNKSAIIAQEMDLIHLEIGEQNLNLV